MRWSATGEPLLQYGALAEYKCDCLVFSPCRVVQGPPVVYGAHSALGWIASQLTLHFDEHIGTPIIGFSRHCSRKFAFYSVARTVLNLDAVPRPVFGPRKLPFPQCLTFLTAPLWRQWQVLSSLWRHHVSLARVSPSLARDGQRSCCGPAAAGGDDKGRFMLPHRGLCHRGHWPSWRLCTEDIHSLPSPDVATSTGAGHCARSPGFLIRLGETHLLCR